MIRIALFLSLSFIFFLFFSCKNTEKSTKNNEYFEALEKKQIVRGHYWPYFIVDGHNNIIKIHVQDQEIIIESQKNELEFKLDSIDFITNKVLIINGKDEFYRALNGELFIKLKNDKLDFKMNVTGRTNYFDDVSNNSNQKVDTFAYKTFYLEKILPKKVESPK